MKGSTEFVYRWYNVRDQDILGWFCGLTLCDIHLLPAELLLLGRESMPYPCKHVRADVDVVEKEFGESALVVCSFSAGKRRGNTYPCGHVHLNARWWRAREPLPFCQIFGSPWAARARDCTMGRRGHLFPAASLSVTLPKEVQISIQRIGQAHLLQILKSILGMSTQSRVSVEVSHSCSSRTIRRAFRMPPFPVSTVCGARTRT